MALLLENFSDGDAWVKMATGAATGDQDGTFGGWTGGGASGLRTGSRWGGLALWVGFWFGHAVGLQLGCPTHVATDDGELVPCQTDALPVDIDEDTQNEAGGK